MVLSRNCGSCIGAMMVPYFSFALCNILMCIIVFCLLVHKSQLYKCAFLYVFYCMIFIILAPHPSVGFHLTVIHYLASLSCIFCNIPSKSHNECLEIDCLMFSRNFICTVHSWCLHLLRAISGVIYIVTSLSLTEQSFFRYVLNILCSIIHNSYLRLQPHLQLYVLLSQQVMSQVVSQH